MTAKEILHKIIANEKRYSVFGIGGDDRIYEDGAELPCSQNMVDDLYDHETGKSRLQWAAFFCPGPQNESRQGRPQAP